MYELPVQGQKKSNATRLNMALDSGIAGAEAAAQCDGERVVAQSPCASLLFGRYGSSGRQRDGERVAAQNRERWMASNAGQEPLRAPSVR